MNQCDGQLKFDICMTFKERMESQGWHNVYDKHPNESGEYKVYRRNGSIGKAQYTQIGEVVRDAYERYKDSDELLDRITNAVSVYVLNQSMGYMEYLRKESEV